MVIPVLVGLPQSPAFARGGAFRAVEDAVGAFDADLFAPVGGESAVCVTAGVKPDVAAGEGWIGPKSGNFGIVASGVARITASTFSRHSISVRVVLVAYVNSKPPSSCRYMLSPLGHAVAGSGVAVPPENSAYDRAPPL